MTDLLAQLRASVADRYRLDRELGRGGMATVYLAHDLKHGRPVAIKVLSPELARALGPDRFLREIRTTAQLTHPNILGLHDSGEAGGLLYYVMPYVEGETLRHRLRREKQLPIEEAVRIAQQVAGALGHAHSRGIVHRDVKPENVLMASGQAVVADFGIAKAVADAGGAGLTETGVSVGTPAYMSPEQAAGERDLDARSDVYSLGCVLYEMLAGEPPFTGPTALAITAKRLAEPVPSLRGVRETVTPALDAAVAKALARAPADRFTTAQDFAQAIGVATAPAPPVATAPSAEEATPGSATLATATSPVAGPPRAGWRAALPWAAVATALVVAAVALSRLAPGGGGSAGGAIGSLAVLPFDNLTTDSSQDYFVDGVHEALIADLVRVGGWRVISRTSVLRYRGASLSIPEIARELNVDGVIEGSVLKAGDSVQIQASLIDGSSDETVRTVTYVRPLRDVLGLLRDVARGIAGELAATAQRRAPAEDIRPVDPIAYEAYLRARHILNSEYGPEWRQAIPLFERAIALDSSFALAYAGLAQAYFLFGFFGVTPRDEAWAAATEVAQRALARDEQSAAAYTVLGWVALFDEWDLPAAERALLRAVRLDPNDAYARHAYADLLSVQGRVADGLREVQLARDADPLSVLTNGAVVGHLYVARRYREAIDEAERVRERLDRPDFLHSYSAASLWQLERYDEALDEYRTNWADEAELLDAVERGYRDGGPHVAIRAAADYRAQGWNGRGAYRVAELYARAGAIDEAFEWLDRAFEERTPSFLHVLIDPAYDPLRSDPRFEALVARMGL